MKMFVNVISKSYFQNMGIVLNDNWLLKFKIFLMNVFVFGHTVSFMLRSNFLLMHIMYYKHEHKSKSAFTKMAKLASLVLIIGTKVILP